MAQTALLTRNPRSRHRLDPALLSTVQAAHLTRGFQLSVNENIDICETAKQK